MSNPKILAVVTARESDLKTIIGGIPIPCYVLYALNLAGIHTVFCAPGKQAEGLANAYGAMFIDRAVVEDPSHHQMVANVVKEVGNSQYNVIIMAQANQPLVESGNVLGIIQSYIDAKAKNFKVASSIALRHGQHPAKMLSVMPDGNVVPYTANQQDPSTVLEALKAKDSGEVFAQDGSLYLFEWKPFLAMLDMGKPVFSFSGQEDLPDFGRLIGTCYLMPKRNSHQIDFRNNPEVDIAKIEGIFEARRSVLSRLLD